jgi:uracil-DNA glycosylase
MIPEIPKGWRKRLQNEREKPYFAKLEEFVAEEQLTQTVFPPEEKIFTALELTPFENVKVVILGQDPYIRKGQAHGLSFSIEDKKQAVPPSLKNIFRELKDNLGVELPNHGNLTHWARQGVLMLNVVLTVREGVSNSHKGKGWENFTDEVIRRINEKDEPVVFVLWGKPAQKKLALIDETKHKVVQAPHPSPLAKGFLGSRTFSQINEALQKAGSGEIDWRIPD